MANGLHRVLASGRLPHHRHPFVEFLEARLDGFELSQGADPFLHRLHDSVEFFDGPVDRIGLPPSVSEVFQELLNLLQEVRSVPNLGIQCPDSSMTESGFEIRREFAQSGGIVARDAVAKTAVYGPRQEEPRI